MFTLQNFFKRLFDICLSLLGLIFLAPIIIYVKVAFLLTGDNAGIFYRQKRIGKKGKEFTLLKFRSMVLNADTVLQEMLKDKKYRLE